MDEPETNASDSAPDPVAGVDAATSEFHRFQRQGDRSALERALALCTPALLWAARGRARPSDVCDVVQECLVVAIRRAAEKPATVSLLPWLLGILNNKVRTRHLLRWRRQSAAPTLAEDAAAAGPDPATLVHERQWADLIAAAVRTLPPRYRDVVTAHLLRGEELAAVAARTGVAPSTVRNQYARGLELLRRRLPAPLLAGLLATLAVRAATGRGEPPLLRFPRMGLAAVVVAVGAVCLALWSLAAHPASSTAEVVRNAAAGRAVVRTAALPAAERIPAHAADAGEPAVLVELRYRSGAPAVDVPVILEPDYRVGQAVNRAAVLWRVQRTDADGRAVFTGLRAGPTAIRLHDLAVLHTFSVGSDEQRFCFAVAESVPVVVHVRDELDQPVSDAEVVVSAAAGGRAPGFVAAATDATGDARFILPMLESWIWVVAGRHAPSAPQRLSVVSADDPSRADRVVVRLRASQRWCRGVVLSPVGLPVAGAVVAVWCADDGAPPQFGATDAAGRFSLGALGPGRCQVAAVAHGFAAGRAVFDAADAEVVCRLQDGCAVTGRVVGAPAVLAGANRTLRIVTQFIDAWHGDALESVGSGVAPDGSFLLTGLVPGRHRLGLFAGGSHPVATALVVAEPDRTPAVELSLTAAPRLVVSVRDEGGRPLPGSLVVVGGRSGEHAWPLQSATCDAAGCASLAVASGSSAQVFVYARRDGRAAAAWPNVARTVTAGSGQIDVVVDDAALDLGALTGRLSPTQLDLVSRHGLWVRRVGHPEARRVSGVDADRFTVLGLPPARYRVESASGDATGRCCVVLAEVEVAAGRCSALDLADAPAMVSVGVTVPLGSASAPLEGRLFDAAEQLLEVFTCPSGTTLQRQLPPGHYRVRYPTATATTGAAEFVLVDRPVAVALAREPGTRCRLEVLGAGVASHRTSLPATIRRASVASGCGLLLREGADAARYAAEVDLQPGCYELQVWLPDGGELCRPFVVSERTEPHVFPFRVP